MTIVVRAIVIISIGDPIIAIQHAIDSLTGEHSDARRLEITAD